MGGVQRRLIVGTNHGGYANARNISALPFQHAEVIRARNLFRLPNYLWFKGTGRLNHYLLNLHWDAGLGRHDLLHLFNGISLSRKPWFSTFETYLPRWGAYGYGNVRWGLKQLAKPACKGILALSECSAEIQRDLLGKHPDLRDAIAAKIKVQHPPQAPLLDAWEQKTLAPDHIDLVLTGADFFRKGGLQVLRVLARLLQAGAPLRLHIVSAMHTGDYATHAGAQELAEAKAIIGKYPAAIAWHPSLPNAEVLALFRRAHIGLLPTWADTYGYTVLEAQAAACPVISTDVRALPEINDAGCGWVIPVKKDGLGNAVLGTEAERLAFGAHLEAGLEAALQGILANPAQVREKGQAALARIVGMHSPAARAEELEKMYLEALGRGFSLDR